MWITIVVVLIVIIVAVLLTLPVQAEMVVSKQGSDFEGFIRISYFFGLLSIRRSLKDVKPGMTDEGPSLHAHTDSHSRKKAEGHRVLTAEEVWKALKNWKVWLQKIHKAVPLIHWLLGKTVITKFTSDVRVGTGDAPSTGMAVGTTYSLLGLVVGTLSSYCSLQDLPQVDVTPNFTTAMFELQQECIFKIRLGYAIWAGIRSFRIWTSMRGN